MAFVHRYFAKVDVERLRAACARAWWRPLRIGGLGEWSCVELRGAALELPFLRRIGAACGESLGLAANTGANAFAFAHAVAGEVVGQYILGDEGRESTGSFAIVTDLDGAPDAQAAVETIEAAFGVRAFGTLAPVHLDVHGVDVSRVGWGLVIAGGFASSWDGATHSRATFLFVAAIASVFAGMVVLFRGARPFERLGGALVLALLEVTMLFALATHVFR
jgi:hypothetical protein